MAATATVPTAEERAERTRERVRERVRHHRELKRDGASQLTLFPAAFGPAPLGEVIPVKSGVTAPAGPCNADPSSVPNATGQKAFGPRLIGGCKTKMHTTKENNQDLQVNGNKGTKSVKRSLEKARAEIEGFALTPELRTWAARVAPSIQSLDEETEDWRDHFRSCNYRMNKGYVADGAACWRHWIRNAERFNSRRGGRQSAPAKRKPVSFAHNPVKR